ncbi:zinc finger protein 43-like [Mercenaria mercenaria]|uniref:zinc finger protein 43-like n=1 Tax=Mercenaria mercenaria TaxID=6596 RepID=UPI00234E90CA|nr:zinc finger protein 43-like [Mercenaria mercenaria]
MKRQNRTCDDDSEDDFESQKDKKKICSSNTDNEDCENDIKSEKQNCYTCKVCDKRFTLLTNLRRHGVSHRTIVVCEHCGDTFSRQDNLQHHKRIHHNEERKDNKKKRDVRCNICDKVFNKLYNLKRHMRTVHKHDSNKGRKQLFTCRYCASEFEKYPTLFAHVMENHPLNQSGGRDREAEKSLIDTDSRKYKSKSTAEAQNKNQSQNDKNIELSNENNANPESLNINHEMVNERDKSALQNSVQNRIIVPRGGGGERYDLLTFFANVRSRILTYLQNTKRRRH